MPYRPKDIARTLIDHGFVLTRQKGSHARFKHPDGRMTTVPMHTHELPKGTFRAIVKQCGLTENDF